MVRRIAVLAFLGTFAAMACMPAAAEPSLEELRERAESGSAEAQLALGTALLERKAERDWSEAVDWLEKAARQGMPVYLLLGDVYHEGLGVARDLVRAAKWYRIGAELGDGMAQLALGRLYLDGDGVPRNLVQAAVYLQLAVERIGDPGVRERAEQALTRAKLWTSWEDWEEARRLARDWKPKPVSELIN